MTDQIPGLRIMVGIALAAATFGAGAALSDAARLEAALGVRGASASLHQDADRAPASDVIAPRS